MNGTSTVVRVPFGCLDGDVFAVVTERGDLAYGRGRGGNWWALRAFGAMCNRQTDLPYPHALWHFPAQIRLAVERVLGQRGREIEMLSTGEFEREIARIASSTSGRSEEAIDGQY